MDGKTPWTPGPWSFYQCHRMDGIPVGEWAIEAPSMDKDSDPITVAYVFTKASDAAIAAAAPALAEALEEMAKVVGCAMHLLKSSEALSDAQTAYANAAAALSQARGGK